MPSAMAVTAMLMVIQIGPSTDRRYRCLMSCQPRCPHSSRCPHPPVRSAKARDHARDVDGTTALDTGPDGTRPPRTGWTLPQVGDHLSHGTPSDHGNPIRGPD